MILDIFVKEPSGFIRGILHEELNRFVDECNIKPYRKALNGEPVDWVLLDPYFGSVSNYSGSNYIDLDGTPPEDIYRIIKDKGHNFFKTSEIFLGGFNLTRHDKTIKELGGELMPQQYKNNDFVSTFQVYCFRAKKPLMKERTITL